jgi:hypothetical protein
MGGNAWSRGGGERQARQWHARGQGIKSPQLHQAQRFLHTPARRRLPADCQREGQVGQLGQGALVGAMQVVPSQHRAGAPGGAWPAAAAGAATGAGEDQVLGVVTWWELAADRLNHQGADDSGGRAEAAWHADHTC